MTKPGPVTIPLDFAPDHAAALGRLLGHWAFLELQIVQALSLILGIEQVKGRVIWQEVVSVRAKVTLLQRLNWTFAGGSLSTELNDLLERAKKLNEMRNAYIHALWGGPGGSGEILTRMRTMAPGNYKKLFGESEPFTAADIQKDVTAVSELSAAFADWQARTAEELATQRREQGK